MNLSNELNKLSEKDIISIILFAIYKFTNNTEYSTLSELIYALDKDSLYNLCATFGGCKIQVPTISELKVFVDAFLVYQATRQEGLAFNDAFTKLSLDTNYKKDIAKVYNILGNIVEEYVKGQA